MTKKTHKNLLHIRLVKLFPSTALSQFIKIFPSALSIDQNVSIFMEMNKNFLKIKLPLLLGSSDNNYLWTHPEAYTKILFHHAYVIAFAILIFIFQTDRESIIAVARCVIYYCKNVIIRRREMEERLCV